MIETVKLASEGQYVINGTVKLYNITVEDEEIYYDVDFDEAVLDEPGAVALCEEFLQKAISKFLADHEAKADTDLEPSSD
jgi:hypothetical protein